jgi:hypothetical protein
MQKFKDRLKYYLIGFTFGLIAIFFFFGGRGCSWLPSNRVKNSIAENEIIYGDSIKALLECNQISNDAVYNLLNSSGDVLFSESKTRETPKKYVLKGENDLKLTFALFEGFSEIVEVSPSSCLSTLSNRHKQIVPLPKKIISSIIESNDFTYYAEAECEMDCYDISKKDIEIFHKNATIDMAKSQPWTKVNASSSNDFVNKHYYLEGIINNKPYAVLYEIGENRTRIKRIIGSFECNCR